MKRTTNRTNPNFKLFSRIDSFDPSRIINIDPSFPAPYNSLENALDIVNNLQTPPAFITNPYLIKLNAGVYNETTSATLILPDGVTIAGDSVFATVVNDTISSNSYPFITCTPGVSEIVNCEFLGSNITSTNNPTTKTNTLISMPSNATIISLTNVSLGGAETCLKSVGVGNVIGMTGNVFISAFPVDFTLPDIDDWTYNTFDIGIDLQNGRIKMTGTCAITDNTVVQGLPIPPFTLFPFTYGIKLTDSRLESTSLNIEGGLTGVYFLRSESAISAGAFNNNVIHFDIYDTQAVNLFSVKTEPATTWDIRVNDTTSTLTSTGCNFDTSMIDLSSANIKNIGLNYYDENLDNERGLHQLGNFIVGDINVPSETWLGQGSTNLSQLTLFKYNGSTFTDVTSDLTPSTATITTLFDDLTNSIFYIGNGSFSGIRWGITTIIDTGSGSIIYEYWNGSAWTELNTMNTEHLLPHGSYGPSSFSVVEEQDVRFNNNSLDSFTDSTVNSVTSKWVRIRIVSTITTSPALDFIKIFGSSTLIDENGVIQYFGKARTKLEIPFNMSFIDASGSTSPVDRTIYISQNLFTILTKNEYRVGDQSTFSFYVPVNLDSSTPLQIEFAYFSNSTSGSQVDFNFDIIYACLDETDQLYLTSGAAPATITKEKTVSFSLTPNQTNGGLMVIDSILLDMSDCIASINGDLIQTMMFRIERTSGNANRIVFKNIGLYGTTYITGLASN